MCASRSRRTREGESCNSPKSLKICISHLPDGQNMLLCDMYANCGAIANFSSALSDRDRLVFVLLAQSEGSERLGAGRGTASFGQHAEHGIVDIEGAGGLAKPPVLCNGFAGPLLQ